MDIPYEKRFFLKDGRAIGSLGELGDTIEKMSKEEFSSYVNLQKNDFYSWIKDVIGDKKLASAVKKIKKQASMAKKLKISS